MRVHLYWSVCIWIYTLTYILHKYMDMLPYKPCARAAYIAFTSWSMDIRWFLTLLFHSCAGDICFAHTNLFIHTHTNKCICLSSGKSFQIWLPAKDLDPILWTRWFQESANQVWWWKPAIVHLARIPQLCACTVCTTICVQNVRETHGGCHFTLQAILFGRRLGHWSGDVGPCPWQPSGRSYATSSSANDAADPYSESDAVAGHSKIAKNELIQISNHQLY